MSGVICDRRIATRVKGKVHKMGVRSAMMYCLETVVLTKRRELKLVVAELKMGVTKIDRSAVWRYG